MGMAKQLHFPVFIQLRPYSCGAAVLQMVVKHLTGEKISHRDAITHTFCEPDGCTMARLKRAIRKFGITVGKCDKRQKAIRTALDADRLVIIDDNDSYSSEHVELVSGYGGKKFWIVDPMQILPRLRPGKDMIKSAEECFTAYVK